MFDFTPVHIHLLLNHAPVFGMIAAVLLLLYGLLRKSAELERTALITFVLTAALAFATDSTGDGAADVARNIPGINRENIKTHNESADTSLLLAEITGGVALVGLFFAWRRKDRAEGSDPEYYVRSHKAPPRWAIVTCLLLGAVCIYFLSVTAYTGGLIRHPEIQTSYTAPPQ